MLEVARFDPENLKKYSAYDGHYTTWEDMKFDDENVVAAFVEKRPGDDLSAPWLFWNDEIWYMVEGELEVEWWSAPMYNGSEKRVLRPGDVIKVPLGVRIKSRVVGEKPVRILWVTMPRPRHFGSQTWWGKDNG